MPPSSHHGWFDGFIPGTAPVTGVPALPTVPALTSRLANDSDCPLLWVREAPSHHDQSPLRLPSDRSSCWPPGDEWLLYRSKFEAKPLSLTCASSCVGMRVT
ncbi:hypothetical protein FQZ97_925950 [compost metagenome]